MSVTLGEKLRQAREERGLTLGDVAEQTRISPLYLESIENDDYRILPGGIFNKGFVKSYAKFVGINENEALSDYTTLVGATTPTLEETENTKTYRPEVLTDDRSGSSMVPTAIFAAVILGLMTAGILFFVNYMRQPAQPVAPTNSTLAANAAEPTPDASPSPAGGVPDMASLKVDVQAVGQAVSISSTTDGKKANTLLNPGTPITLEPRDSLKLSYSRSLASNVKLSINGRDIAVPSQPLTPGKGTIEFEISKDNLGQIWANSSIGPNGANAAPAANTVAANTEPAAAVPRPATTPAVRPTAKPTAAPSNSAPANTAGRPAATPRPVTPPANRPRPAGNNDR
jgi:cytoskeletal protein RodZ